MIPAFFQRQKEFERNREYNEFLSNKVATGGQSRARPSEDAPGSFFPDPDKENEVSEKHVELDFLIFLLLFINLIIWNLKGSSGVVLNKAGAV